MDMQHTASRQLVTIFVTLESAWPPPSRSRLCSFLVCVILLRTSQSNFLPIRFEQIFFILLVADEIMLANPGAALRRDVLPF
ncbi:MAG: hypothetical protein JRJ12_08235 [Deltaproteobacteria bacterium]|nr:hypothetical protein [Deltaproteobacteria bacterium]